MTPVGKINPTRTKLVVSSLSSPEEFADRVVAKARDLPERSVLTGREGIPISEEYLAAMRADLVSRCVTRGTVGDPQAKF